MPSTEWKKHTYRAAFDVIFQRQKSSHEVKKARKKKREQSRAADWQLTEAAESIGSMAKAPA